MNLLAIDPGTTAGWAIWYLDGNQWKLESGIWAFRGSSYGERYRKFLDKLREVNDRSPLDHIAYEQPYIHQRPDKRTGKMMVDAKSIELSFGWVGHIKSFCEIYHLSEPTAYQANSWRSRVYGQKKVIPPKEIKSPADRKDWHIQNAKNFCATQLDLYIENGDEAEAVAMLEAFKADLDPQADFANQARKTGQEELLA